MRLCPQSALLVDLIATMRPAERRLLMLTMRRVIALQNAGEDEEAADFLEDMRHILATPDLRRELPLEPLNG